MNAQTNGMVLTVVADIIVITKKESTCVPATRVSTWKATAKHVQVNHQTKIVNHADISSGY
jgi:hypothetical protein